jgi:hypothetical protein
VLAERFRTRESSKQHNLCLFPTNHWSQRIGTSCLHRTASHALSHLRGLSGKSSVLRKTTVYILPPLRRTSVHPCFFDLTVLSLYLSSEPWLGNDLLMLFEQRRFLCHDSSSRRHTRGAVALARQPVSRNHGLMLAANMHRSQRVPHPCMEEWQGMHAHAHGHGHILLEEGSSRGLSGAFPSVDEKGEVVQLFHFVGEVSRII